MRPSSGKPMNINVNADMTPQAISRFEGLPAIQGPISKNNKIAPNKKRAK
jgi:hypothetical protein